MTTTTQHEEFARREALRGRARAVHGSGVSLVAMASGGALEALTELTATPGASAVFEEALVPWGRGPMADRAGQPPPSKVESGRKSGGAVSPEHAVRMAHAAWTRASELAAGRPAVGVAVTAALAAEPPRKTPPQAYVAVQSGTSGETVAVTRVTDFFSGLGRAGQSLLVGGTALWELASALSGGPRASEDPAWEAWTRGGCLAEALRPPVPTQAALAAALAEAPGRGVVLGRDGSVHRAEDYLKPEAHYVYGGRFAPAHWGHFSLKARLDRATGKDGVLNVTRAHPSKGRAADEDVAALLRACAGKADVLLDERAWRYAEKVSLWGCDLAMGLDVFQSVSDADVAAIAAAGATMHVANRPGTRPDWRKIGGAASTGRLAYYPDISWDVSSTRIRTAKAIDLR